MLNQPCSECLKLRMLRPSTNVAIVPVSVEDDGTLLHSYVSVCDTHSLDFDELLLDVTDTGEVIPAHAFVSTTNPSATVSLEVVE